MSIEDFKKYNKKKSSENQSEVAFQALRAVHIYIYREREREFDMRNPMFRSELQDLGV